VEAARLRLATDLDDVARLSFSVSCHGLGDRRWSRAQADARHRGLLRHDRCYGAFGLIFTPAFYVICRWLAALSRKVKTSAVAPSEPAE